ncbi:MAG: response regulator transcription factor [Elainellaceae cyanobacterium]
MKTSLTLQSPVKPQFRAQTAPILLIGNEDHFSKILVQELSCEGYPVAVAYSDIDGLLKARRLHPSLIVLDWFSHGFSSLDFCQRLRAAGNAAPLILLTSEDRVGDRIAGLDAGADDCISRPFSLEELLARVRARLRRSCTDSTDILCFEDLMLNRKTREVLRSGQRIELTAKEFDLLEYLMVNRRHVVSREQILEKVWGYDFMGDSNVIEVYIRYLRLKLEAYSSSRLIHTVRCVGYVLRESA